MNFLHPNGTFGTRIFNKVNWEPMFDDIRKWIGEKLSAQQIADRITLKLRITVTRNAVIGQIHRHHLGQLSSESVHNTRAFARPVRVPRARKYKPAVRFELPLSPPLIEDSLIPIEQRKTFMELTDSTCRWPVGEVGEPGFFFCGGDAVDWMPYCGAHCRRAFNYEATRRSFKPYYARRAA